MEDKYELLGPIDNVENKTEDALSFALNNKNCNNIAITGPYSSGKSSIINSYIKKNIKKEEIMNISFANFEYGNAYKDYIKLPENNKNKSDNEEKEISSLKKLITINDIEQTIVQKIYFSTKNDYEESKIKDNTKFIYAILFFIISIVVFFNFDTIFNGIIEFFARTITQPLIVNYIEIKFGCYIIAGFILLVNYLINRIAKTITNIKSIKITGKDLIEVNVENGYNPLTEFFDKNLELIIELIEASKYKYFVFEDLDRFDNPLIFEKIRDLNFTLNSSLKNRKIKFIYLIKDDIFSAENRAKFFDFIYPVVPYVSYGSSGDELYNIINNEYNLSNEISLDFINDVSIFISDIRILKNTLNEYRIYNKSLNIKIEGIIPCQKLFSIILYKNIFPEDFALLQKKEGNLYEILTKQNAKQDKLDDELNFITLDDLKVLLINRVDSKNTNCSFVFENQIPIKEPNAIKSKLNQNNMFNNSIKIRNNNGYTYLLNEFIDAKDKEFYNYYLKYKTYYQKIEDNEHVKLNSVKNLIKENYFNDEMKFEKYNDLIRFLLANGWIDENYNIYINQFHNGSLEEEDYDFVKNAKEKLLIPINYKYKIHSVANVMKKLNNEDYKSEQILNISLLDKLLKGKDEENLINFLNTLSNSDIYINFLKDCIVNNNSFDNKKEFIENICNHDADIINKIYNQELEENPNILKMFFINLEVEEIKKLNNYEKLLESIEEKNLLSDEKVGNIEQKLIALNVSFSDVSYFGSNKDLYDFIVENNLYKINYENIEYIILKDKQNEGKNILKSNLKLKNYESLSNFKKIKQYVDNSINDYIENVYKKLYDQQEDKEETVVSLLNNKDIDSNIILKKEKNNITNIETVNNSELWKNIIINNLFDINWNNIIKYYNKYKIDNNLIIILNDKLMKKIITKKEIVENKVSEIFIKSILTNNEINSDNYKAFIMRTEIKVSNIDLIDIELSEEKLKELILNSKLEYSLNIFKLIQSKYNNLLILEIEKNADYINNDILNITFNNTELEAIFSNNNQIHMDLKINVIKKSLSINNITNKLANEIIDLIIDYNNKNIIEEPKILIKILSMANKDEIDNKVKFINLNFDIIDATNINEILRLINQDYENIIIPKKKPKLKNTQWNQKLIDNLIKKFNYSEKIISKNSNGNYIIITGLENKKINNITMK